MTWTDLKRPKLETCFGLLNNRFNQQTPTLHHANTH